jgi:ABC-type Fe3+ transport system substrate-binding protein
MKRDRAPVDWLTVGPIPATRYFVVVPKSAPHVNAGRLWTAWLASPEGQVVSLEELHYESFSGNNLGPSGRRIRDAGSDVVLELEDPARNLELLKLVADTIGVLK